MIPARPNRELISTLDSALRVYMQHQRHRDFDERLQTFALPIPIQFDKTQRLRVLFLG